MIKFVIFDVMGVVFTVGNDVEGMLIPYIQSMKPEVSDQSIYDAYMAASLGQMTSFDLWEGFGFEKTAVPEIERKYLENSYTLDAGFLSCAGELKKRYCLALLSNDVSEWSKFLRAYYGIEPLIDAAFISGDIGIRKPDVRIYRFALDALGVKPKECLFVDDYPDRVEAACELGICSILFNREDFDFRGLSVTSFEQLSQLL
jgi:putative hydrolase of the HAD superfamily